MANPIAHPVDRFYGSGKDAADRQQNHLVDYHWRNRERP